MTERIIFSRDGVRVSRPGFDASVASPDNLGMYPGMGVMAQVLENTVTLGGGGAQDFAFPNPTGKLPYVILNATSGECPDRSTFCAEITAPYTSVRIRNEGGQPTRTIRFAVLIDNN